MPVKHDLGEENLWIFYSDFSVIPLVDSLSLSIQEYPLKTNFAQRKYPSPAEYAIRHHRRSSDKETSA